MNSDIKTVLNKIESKGYDAYVIGGYVRDNILNIETYDVDIATNALLKDLIKIFTNSTISDYGTMKLNYKEYRFDIATFRKEFSYKNRRPTNIEYVKTLKEDLIRRDFTINTIAMNSNGEIIDNLDGINDIRHKLIRSVGNVDKKFKEDPLRILRAIRFSSKLNFKLDKSVVNAIKDNYELVSTLSSTRIKEEFDRILSSKNVIKTLKYMKKLNILKVLNISYKRLVYVEDVLGMYAQMELDDNYPFTKEEKKNIELIKENIKRGKIDNKSLYENGLYISLVSAKILGKNVSKISKMYDELPIKSIKDLNVTSGEIINILNIEPSNVVKIVINDIINKVLNKKLKNEKDELITYIINNKGGILNEYRVN